MDVRRSSPVQDQAARLRELVARGEQVAGKALTVAVLSGKGGVGKTNIAVNLAICLAARGLRVTLLDADVGLANADVLLNVSAQYNLSHVVAGLRRIDQVGTVVAGGVFFVPGASGLERVADLSEVERQAVIAQMRRLGGQTDVAVLDCGAGLSPNVLSFALAADLDLVVTTPEPTAVTDAYAVVKVLARRGKAPGSVRLLVNLAESRQEARKVYARVAGVAERFLQYPIAEGGYLLHDTHVELAVRQRCPFVLRYPRCAASACISAIAGRLAGSGGAARGTGGFFRRVVGMFV